MLRKLSTAVFFLQGTSPLLWSAGWPFSYRLWALFAFVVYGVLALEIWIGHRKALLLAIILTAFQFVGVSSRLLSWRLLVGPGLLIGLAPVAHATLDWKIVWFLSHGLALNYALGEPCVPLQRDLGRDYQMVWINWVAALVFILLLIVWVRRKPASLHSPVE